MKAQTTATLRYLRMSPRKVRLLVDLIRGMRVTEAVAQLSLSKKDAALPVLKLLRSAVANATHNDHLDPKTLVIQGGFVNGGPILYRSTPKAFGRASRIRKRTSHITLILEGELETGTKKKEVKNNETEEKLVAESSEITVEEATPKKKTIRRPVKKTTAKKMSPKKSTKSAKTKSSKKK